MSRPLAARMFRTYSGAVSWLSLMAPHPSKGWVVLVGVKGRRPAVRTPLRPPLPTQMDSGTFSRVETSSSSDQSSPANPPSATTPTRYPFAGSSFSSTIASQRSVNACGSRCTGSGLLPPE